MAVASFYAGLAFTRRTSATCTRSLTRSAVACTACRTASATRSRCHYVLDFLQDQRWRSSASPSFAIAIGAGTASDGNLNGGAFITRVRELNRTVGIPERSTR